MNGDDAGSAGILRKTALAGLFLNIAVALFKGACGYLSGSKALIADAVHSVSDLTTDMAVIFGVKYWSMPPDENHPYGHGKIETIVTAFIGGVLCAVAVGMCKGALSALRSPPRLEPSFWAFAAALFSVVSKEILFRWTVARARRISSGSLEANAWHHRTDALSSLPVAAALAGGLISPKLAFLDPIGAIFVSVFILRSGWEIMRPALMELTDGTDGKVASELGRISLSHPEVASVHHARARRFGSGYLGDVHIRIDGNLSVRRGHEIAHEVKSGLLAAGLGLSDVIIHVEPDR